MFFLSFSENFPDPRSEFLVLFSISVFVFCFRAQLLPNLEFFPALAVDIFSFTAIWFGIWISQISDLATDSQISDLGFGFGISDFRSGIRILRSQIWDPGFGISDLRSGIWGSGFPDSRSGLSELFANLSFS